MVSAIEFFGSQAKLVEAIGCFSQQTISRVLNCENEPAPELAAAIHNATGGKVPKWTLRPDLFDAPAQALSAEVA
jgi:DNA-binding transcriptional regulator YdaS (Cro superfamily)